MLTQKRENMQIRKKQKEKPEKKKEGEKDSLSASACIRASGSSSTLSSFRFSPLMEKAMKPPLSPEKLCRGVTEECGWWIRLGESGLRNQNQRGMNLILVYNSAR